MSEITINDRTYRTCTMSAFQQFHVARRLLPVLAKMPEMLGMTLAECMESSDAIMTKIGANLDMIRLDVIADTFAGLKDADADYILDACQDAIEIKEPKGAGWSRIRRNGKVMYDHIGIQELMGFTVTVIKDNLSGFFSGSGLKSPEPTAKTTT